MSDCERCGKCCTSFGVCITPSDILRISSATGKKPDEFVTSIPEPPGRERTEPAVMLGGERSLIVLRWKTPGAAGREDTAHRICPFHSPAGCTIYSVRPLLCRTYPFVIKDGRLADVGSRRCPSAWKPEDESGYATDIGSYSQELEAYRVIADGWNHANPQGTLTQFIAFALGEACR